MPNLDRNLIKALPVFSAMGDVELDEVIAQANALRIPKGTAVFRQGDLAKAFFVLLHGRLKVLKVTPRGQQIIIRFVHPGDIFGIAKALRREDYPATAIAVVDSIALAWPAQIWDDFMATHPAFALNVMQMMGDRLQEAHTRLKELSTEEVEHRLAHTVVRLVTQSGRQTDEGVLVDFPITQQDLAEASGTTLHSVSRILSVWQSAGLVTVGRRRIVVRDVPALAALAEHDPRQAAAEQDRSR